MDLIGGSVSKVSLLPVKLKGSSSEVWLLTRLLHCTSMSLW